MALNVQLEALTVPFGTEFPPTVQAPTRAERNRAYQKLYYRKNRDKILKKTMVRYEEIKANPEKWRRRLDLQRPHVREWRSKNREVYLASVRAWQRTARGKVSLNASRIRARNRNPLIALKHITRCRIGVALRKNYKSGYKKPLTTQEILGCSIAELRVHLEGLFSPGMTWENRGKFGWHIDHIRPCSSFNLLDPEQLKLCFHYTNLQPMWARDNWAKGDKIQ